MVIVLGMYIGCRKKKKNVQTFGGKTLRKTAIGKKWEDNIKINLEKVNYVGG
jgi:hypothetical protein